MRRKLPVVRCWASLFATCTVAATLLVSHPPAAAQTTTGEDPVLTVDNAVTIAAANNRNLKIAALNIDNAREEWLGAKTKRYTAFSTYVFGSDLLTSLSFTIKEGQFGTYDATGPIPGKDIQLKTSSGSPTAYVIAKASQPLTTLHKINLNVRAQALNQNQASEQLRGGRQSLAASVRQTYYSIMQAESAIEAIKADIKQYEELDRITTEYVAEKTALQSDNLQVKARLAQEQYSLVQLQDKLQEGKENLNDLMGRDIATPFRTAPVSELSTQEQDLPAAQEKALAQHPQIKQAALTVQQAEIQRRLAKSQYIPDLGLTFQYISPFGINFLPQNIASVGLELNWDPYDWGARRHQVNQASIGMHQSQVQLTETRSQVLINVNTQFRTLQETRMAVTVAKANQDSTREKLREVTQQYGQKAALLSDVLKQQAASESADSDYNQAMASFWTATANFKKALGDD